MKIAIVDDVHRDQLYLADSIKEFFLGSETIPEIDFYDSGEQFIRYLDKRTYSLVFLDIYLGGMTGMDVAKCIHENKPDTKIVFQSTSDEFGVASYAVNALYYIIKPYSKQELWNALKRFEGEGFLCEPFIDVVFNRTKVRLLYSDICYIDTEKRKTIIHAEEKVFPTTKPFSEMTQSLVEDKRFLLCRRGVMVNMDAVDDVLEDEFLLKNGDKVPLHLRNKVKIKQMYLHYVTERMRR